MNTLARLSFTALLAGLFSTAVFANAPNVVLILVDDAGLMDFGGYGGEAMTPNINQLADKGIRFSNYHTTPLCSTSRAMLLTGDDNHRVGVGTIPEVIHKSQRGSPAYSLRLHPGVETIASLLGDAGFSTYMTGKWHLGNGVSDLPYHHGFDRSFVLDASGADNWEHKTFMPLYDDAHWYEDDQSVRLPDDFFSSEFIVQKMIDYLEERDRTVPFFSYLAFQAVHIPVQAPKTFTDNYEDTYAAGWDVLREQRITRARELGLAPIDALAPEPHPKLRKFSELSEEEQQHYRTSMMVNAGMLESMDYEIGQLIEYLKAEGELENTLFIITSDNGPEFNDPVTSPLFRFWMANNDYHTDIERAGEQGYMGAIGPEWASVAAVPGSLFKMYASEGGTRVPLIISGPGVATQPGFNAAFTFVADIAPTIASLTNTSMTEEIVGVSLAPLLNGDAQTVRTAEEATLMETAGSAALFKGDYKLVKNSLPHGDAQWRLHNLKTDPAERVDLATTEPELKASMLAQYQALAATNGVIELPDDYNVQTAITKNTVLSLFENHRLMIISITLTVTLLILLAGRTLLRR